MLDRRHRRKAGAGLWTRCLIVLSALLAAYASLAPFAATAQSAPPAVTPSPVPVGPSPLLADDDPPPRSPTALAWAGGGANIGGQACWFGADDRLAGYGASGLEPCTVGINDHLRVFMDDGRSEEDLARITDVRIVRPDGGSLEQVPGEDGTPIWWIPPGSPTGRYALSARRDGREVQSDFTVALSEAWHEPVPLVTTWPAVGPSGTRFRVVLAGFEPGQTVSIYLYQGLPLRNGLYLTTLDTVRANERGEATSSVPSRAGDPEGVYSIVTDPPSRGFVLGAARFGISASLSLDDLETREYDLWRTAADRGRHERRARAIVYDANRVFASVVAKDGRGIEYLRCVYDEPWLSRVTASVREMRDQGQYRVASMPVRPTIQELSLSSAADLSLAPFEVTVSETWDDRLFDAGGQILSVNPSRVTWRYKVRYGTPNGSMFGGQMPVGEPLPTCETSSWFIWDAEKVEP